MHDAFDAFPALGGPTSRGSWRPLPGAAARGPPGPSASPSSSVRGCSGLTVSPPNATVEPQVTVFGGGAGPEGGALRNGISVRVRIKAPQGSFTTTPPPPTHTPVRTRCEHNVRERTAPCGRPAWQSPSSSPASRRTAPAGPAHRRPVPRGLCTRWSSAATAPPPPPFYLPWT